MKMLRHSKKKLYIWIKITCSKSVLICITRTINTSNEAVVSYWKMRHVQLRVLDPGDKILDTPVRDMDRKSRTLTTPVIPVPNPLHPNHIQNIMLHSDENECYCRECLIH